MTFPFKQTGAYWAPIAQNGFGHAQYASPVLVPVRWEIKREMFINASGETLASSDIVYSATELMVNGKMLLINSLTGLTSAPPATARRIESATVSPSLSPSQNLYKQWLK